MTNECEAGEKWNFSPFFQKSGFTQQQQITRQVQLTMLGNKQIQNYIQEL